MSLYVFIWTKEVKWSEKLAKKLQKTDVECISADDPEVRKAISKKITKVPAVIVCDNNKGKTEMYIEEHKEHIYNILNVE